MRLLSPLSAAAVAAALVISIPPAGGQEPRATDPVAAPRPAAWTAHDLLSRIPADRRTPDAEAMVRAIAAGEMGPNQGWYRPGQSRFDWEWLRSRFDTDGDAAVTDDEFRGPAKLFAKLDRDRSGQVRQDDFDWSDASPYMRQLGQATQLFRRLDDSSDGRLDRDEWLGAFERLSAEDDAVTAEDLLSLLFPPRGRMERPSTDVLLSGLISGEIGSHHPGPEVGDPAPEFELRTHDGEDTVRLTDFRGKQPVVLIFGSFTWGPFRSQFGAIEQLYREYGDEAAFLAVYVREAHPTDGWRMTSNDRAGIAVAQPTTFEERTNIAAQCCTQLKMSVPLVVDELDDRVGHAYSGMPDRLYIVDRDGRVAYKGGRGPFEFKPGEMEQALILLLLSQQDDSASD